MYIHNISKLNEKLLGPVVYAYFTRTIISQSWFNAKEDIYKLANLLVYCKLEGMNITSREYSEKSSSLRYITAGPEMSFGCLHTSSTPFLYCRICK